MAVAAGACVASRGGLRDGWAWRVARSLVKRWPQQTAAMDREQRVGPAVAGVAEGRGEVTTEVAPRWLSILLHGT
ncbi:unnamed protein product [Urochloa humidicola]